MRMNSEAFEDEFISLRPGSGITGNLVLDDQGYGLQDKRSYEAVKRITMKQLQTHDHQEVEKSQLYSSNSENSQAESN